MLCSPEGEQHNLGCCVIESVLLDRGYKVLNASPSAPFDSIIRYVMNGELDAILICVTLLENMGICGAADPLYTSGQQYTNSHWWSGTIESDE